MRVIRKGFSLIELLLAIAVMVVMAAAALALIGPSSRRYARDVQRKSDLEQIRSALELYRNSNSNYPAALPTLAAGSYISSIPVDPLSPTRVYYYPTPVPGGTTYYLCASLEKWVGATPTPQAGCASGCGLGCNYRVIQP